MQDSLHAPGKSKVIGKHRGFPEEVRPPAGMTISVSKASCANGVPLNTRQVLPVPLRPYRKPRMWLIAPPLDPMLARLGIR